MRLRRGGEVDQMSKDKGDSLKSGGEWLLMFAGAGLASVLVSLFLLNDPYWKLAALDAPEDDTADVVAELFVEEDSLGGAGGADDVQEPIHYAFADIEIRSEAPRMPAVGTSAPPDPFADPGPRVPSSLKPVDYAETPDRAQPAAAFDDAVMLAQTQATRGFDAPVLEDKLELTQPQRAVIQRRLILAGHDPKGVDGIFGDETRAAIAAFQDDMGFAATGFLDAPGIIALTNVTRESYASWRKARDRRRAMLASAVKPQPRPVQTQYSGRTERCNRTRSGDIIAYQSMVCDLTGFAESFWRFGRRDLRDDANSRFAELAYPDR